MEYGNTSAETGADPPPTSVGKSRGVKDAKQGRCVNPQETSQRTTVAQKETSKSQMIFHEQQLRLVMKHEISDDIARAVRAGTVIGRK